MKKFTKTLLTSSIIAGAALGTSVAQAEIEASVGLATHYIFRGLDLNNNGPHINGSFDYSHESGFYAGTWAGSISSCDEASTEIDYYGGYAFETGDLGLDFGVVLYTIPHSGTDVITELYGIASYAGFDASVYFDITDEEDSANEVYVNLAYGLDVGNGFTVGAAVGVQTTETDGADDVVDWALTVAKEFQGVELSLGYYDTDVDEAPGDEDSDNITFAISKSF